jgi:iron complex outermembrane recepter protein
MTWKAVVCAAAGAGLGLMVALPLLATAAQAEPRNPAPEQEPEPSRTVILDEIRVKSQARPGSESLEIREVRESAARDLGEALSATAGVEKIRKGPIANDVVVRGQRKDDVAVTVDGAHVHGACPSRMDPPSFHLDYAEVDTVEVRKGPFDVRQPGGVGGTVDVRTRGIPAGAATELNAAGGSQGAFDTSARASWGGTRWGAMVGGAWKLAEPYRTGDGSNVLEAVPAELGGSPNAARYRDTSAGATAYDIRTGFAKLRFTPAAGHRLELAYTRQSALDVVYPYLRMDGITDDTDRATVTWALERAGAVRRASGRAYWSRVEHDMTDERRCSAAPDPAACLGTLPSGWSMRTLARSTVFGGAAELELALALPVQLTAGVDYYERNWDNVTSRVRRAAPGQPVFDEASVPDVTIRDAGVRLEGARAIGPLRLTAGGRVDVARSEAGEDRSALWSVYAPGDASRERTDWLAAGNVQAELVAGSGFTLSAGLGHGERVPDPQERYFALTGMMGSADWVGRPGLDPVRSDEVDVGVSWRGRGVFVKAQAFHAWLDGAIVLADLAVEDASGPRRAKTYLPVDARTYGYEVSGRAALPVDLFASASVSQTLGRDETRGGWLAEIPPLRANAGLRWDPGWAFVELEEVYAAEQDRVDPRLGESATPAWWITNLRVGTSFRGMTILASVRNLFDRRYVEHLSYTRDPFATGTRVPEPGRSFQVGVQYAL